MKLDPKQFNVKQFNALDAFAKNNTPDTPISDDILAILNEDNPEADAQAEAILSGKTAGAIAKELAKSSKRRMTLAEFPPVVPESENPDILIRGRWLERGGSAFLVSTAGTGKSIWMTQFAISMVHGVEFSGLSAWKPLKVWVIQSEDSPSRVAIDREDIVAGLTDQWAERYPDIDWKRATEQVVFVDFTGHTGAGFLEQLRNELEAARDEGATPDVVIINPFMDFLGADVTSNADTIAFLSGGILGNKRTEGLRSILKEFKTSALIAHHTAKPPTDAELASWIMSDMPEYKACGAGYITNWGRSFVTLMKIPGLEGVVMLTAGKNGSGLGWKMVEGARRIFLKWATESSSGGTGRRHFWVRVTDPQELADIEDTVAGLRKGRKRNHTATEKCDHKAQFEPVSAARYWAHEIFTHHLGKDSGVIRDIIFEGVRREGLSRADSRMIYDTLCDIISKPDNPFAITITRDKFGRKTFVENLAESDGHDCDDDD